MNENTTIRETPDSVCAKMVEMASISDFMSILEPSAGNGKIASYILEKYSFTELYFTLIELNKEKCDYMKANLNPDWEIVKGDFLNFQNTYSFDNKTFDRVIACPPFKGNIDVVHIEKMYSLLAKKGLMVTLTSPYWLTNNEPHQVHFREWLADKDYYMKVLPDNSFMEKGRSVPTAILKIFKK